jgi:hypothetical protein
MQRKKEVMQYPDILQRIYTLLAEIKNVAEEIGTNDLTLVAHLLILDSIRYKNLHHFTGVEITRAGEGKKLNKDK